MAFTVLHDAETVQVLEPATMVQLVGVVRMPETTGGLFTVTVKRLLVTTSPVVFFFAWMKYP